MSHGESRFVFRFWPGGSDLDPQRVDLLGGKGASLAALSRANFPVPPGFTISVECGEHFTEHGDWPEGLEREVRDALDWLESQTGKSFGAAVNELRVAVRSGAVDSMPGMLATILECGRAELSPDAETTPTPMPVFERLRLAINEVFASWRTERASAYRKQRRLETSRGTAVTVQVMFAAESAGVLFTTDPLCDGSRTIVIEGVCGTGDSLVSGNRTPHQWRLDATDSTLTDLRAGEGLPDDILSSSQASQLARLGLQLADTLGYDCDVEWARSGDTFAILQARPIRREHGSLSEPDSRSTESILAHELNRLRQSTRDEATIWVTHNLSESLPCATPLTTDLMTRWFHPCGALGKLYRELGFSPRSMKVNDDDAVRTSSILEFIGGRPYVDPRHLPHLFFDDLPFVYPLDEVSANPTLLDAAPRRIAVERAGPFFFLQIPRIALLLWRASRRERLLLATAKSRLNRAVTGRLEPFLKSCQRVDLKVLDGPALAHEWIRRRDFVLGDFAAETLLPGYLGGLAFARTHASLVQYFGETLGDNLAMRLVSGLDQDLSVRQSEQLASLANGRVSLASFLAEFGHRGGGEMELSNPRWNDSPTQLERLLPALRSPASESPLARHERQRLDRLEIERQLPSLLAEHGASSLYESLVENLRVAQRLLPWREVGKHHLLRGYATLRSLVEEWSHRTSYGDLAYQLTERELLDAFRGRPVAIGELKRRRQEWRELTSIPFPDVMDSRQLDELAQRLRDGVRPHSTNDSWPARPLARGASTGIAKVVADPHTCEPPSSDSILICPSPDPGWMPWMLQAKGMIVERGGALSHGALVARELGLPTVALSDATRLFQSGDRLRVDANTGCVTRLEGSGT